VIRLKQEITDNMLETSVKNNSIMLECIHQPIKKKCRVNVPKINISEYLSSKPAQEVAQIFDYIRMHCSSVKIEVNENDQKRTSCSSPRTEFMSGLGLKPAVLQDTSPRRKTMRLRKRASVDKLENMQAKQKAHPQVIDKIVVAPRKTVLEVSPMKKVHFPLNPVTGSVEIPRIPNGRLTRQNVMLSGYEQQMFISHRALRGVGTNELNNLEEGFGMRKDSGSHSSDAKIINRIGTEGSENVVDMNTNFFSSPVNDCDSGIYDPSKDSRENTPEVDINPSEKALDIMNEKSNLVPSEYTEPEVSNGRIDVQGTKVTDYRPFKVTRSTNKNSCHGYPNGEQSFEAYKEQMQLKLINNQNASLCEIDLDSDSDISEDWQPSRTEEDLERIESDEDDDDFKPSKVSLEGLIEKYKCENCGKVYQKSGHWLKHVRDCCESHVKIESIEQNSLLQCSQCKATFATPGSLQRHLVNLHGHDPREAVHKTPDIKIEIELKPDNIEMKPKNDLLVCDSCGKGFVKAGHLLIHMKTVHKTPDKMVDSTPIELGGKPRCQLCKRNFFNYPSLRRHLKLHERISHKTEHRSPTANLKKTFSCKRCNKSFFTSPSLTRHMRADHQGFKSKCSVCDETVARLDNHMSQVHSKKLTPCPICAKLLATTSISRHVKTVHLGCMVRCVHCDKFVSNIHKHKSHEHTDAAEARKTPHKEHQNCDSVFFLGPSAFFLPKSED